MQSTPETRAHAQEILDYIHANPEKHDQAYFFTGNPNMCGTTMCIAGTSVFLKNAKTFDDMPMGAFADKAAANLGLSMAESEVVFFEMDEERAIQKLKKVVVGEEFSKEDFYVANGEQDGLTFDEFSWDEYTQGE